MAVTLKQLKKHPFVIVFICLKKSKKYFLNIFPRLKELNTFLQIKTHKKKLFVTTTFKQCIIWLFIKWIDKVKHVNFAIYTTKSFLLYLGKTNLNNLRKNTTEYC